MHNTIIKDSLLLVKGRESVYDTKENLELRILE